MPVGVRVAVVVGDDTFADAVSAALESVVPQQGTGSLRGHRARDLQQESKARRVEAGTERVPGVERTREEGDRFHGPVEAEPSGTQEEPEVEGGKVEESEDPGQERVAVRGWIVRRGEIGRFAAHQVEP